jgi:rubredoxin
MSVVIDYINKQIFQANRNFVGIIVGRVGTGKSYSAMRLGELLDKKFSIDKVFFNVEDLLKVIHENELYAGECLVLDEAGVAISNRQHYMNKFNKSMSFLLQTWRHRNLILLVTVPDIKFVDAGIRKLFDAVIECKKVVKSRNIVQADWKFIQINPHSGKVYTHNLKTSGQAIRLDIGKPDIKLIHVYEKKKKEFTDSLYRDLEISTNKEEVKDKLISNAIKENRRCPQCGLLGIYMASLKQFQCRGCGLVFGNAMLPHKKE